jgi:hypothetical protein
MPKSKKRIRKPANAQLIASTARNFAHQNSIVVQRQRQLHEFEMSQTDEAIEHLMAALAQQRRKRAELAARITGLTLVIERRISTFGSTETQTV